MGLPGSSVESVIVVMDANRSRRNTEELEWAFNHVVRPRDAVLVLGILSQSSYKRMASSSSLSASSSSSSCLPFFSRGIGISSIWERLEFSVQGDMMPMPPKVLEEEISKKMEEFQSILQSTLQPFYWKCRNNNVKLEIKLAAGFSPKKITIEEAQNTNTRWIVLDSQLKKDIFFIHERAGCNVAVVKENGRATIMPSLAAEKEESVRENKDTDQAAPVVEPEKVKPDVTKGSKDEKLHSGPLSNRCWYPLSWRPGFPQNLSFAQVECITNNLSSENIICEEESLQVYRGILQETPVLVKHFFGSHERFWSELKILSRVRHRNILNLVGYCFSDASMFLLCDHPCNGSLNIHLQCDELAKKLFWKERWDIAVGVCGCLRYLHEECQDGPILHLAICSSHIVLSHSCSPLLTNFTWAKRLLEGDDSCNEVSSREGPIKFKEHLSLDVHAYGLFLLELITGQTLGSDPNAKSQFLVDWALPLIENESVTQIMDPRLEDSSKNKKVHLMACAALLCLKDDSGHVPRMSEVEATIRGDKVAQC